MSTRQFRQQWILAAVVCLVFPVVLFAENEPTLTKDQIKQFLLTGNVIQVQKWPGPGKTHPSRLTLSDGKITHDASFQDIDEHKMGPTRKDDGSIEMNFVDSYKYNIAAYQLAEMIGMDDMVPVYVERKWKGKTGSLSWWLPVKMDEGDRLRQHIPVPDPDAWNKQMYKIRILDQLVYDTDPNLTNVLVGENFQIWRIDFTRAFRTLKDLQQPKDLTRCDRQLLEKLRALDGKELAARTKGYLSKPEVEGVMARRDKIVALYQKLIAEKGEDAVLY